MEKQKRHKLADFIVPVVLLIVAGCGSISLGYGVFIKCKAIVAEQLLRGAWSQIIEGKKFVKPWPWADTSAFARLQVPALGVDLIVLEGGTGRTLAFGPGHIDGSAQPGAPGNCSIIGHRDTSFHFLADMSVGDMVYVVSRSNVKFKYMVIATKVVTDRDSRVTAFTDLRTLTLITCYPFDSPFPGNERYIVRAVLV
jgi:sortase A